MITTSPKVTLKEFLKSNSGRKCQRQVKLAHQHKTAFLRFASQGVELGAGEYLATDDLGNIVQRRMVGGQCLGHEDRELH